jgi:peptidase E
VHSRLESEYNAALWYKPEFKFISTHDVYIIGLSLAHDDFFIRSLFLSNLPYIEDFSDITGRKIFIITPDSKAAENYKFVLSKGHAELIHEEFSIKHVELMKDRIKNI